MVMSKYQNAFAEVDTILGYLNAEELKKIPAEVIQAIKVNRNKAYDYTINPAIELRGQPMMMETKAILFKLFRDYLCTETQREKIISMQREEKLKKEEKKKQLYKIDVFADQKEAAPEPKKVTENLEMVEYKESIFKKLIYKIKNFFK